MVRARHLRVGLLVLTGTLAVASSASSATQAISPSPSSFTPATAKALVDQYCVPCHSERLKTGGLVLERADLTAISQQAELWEKVIRKLRVGLMPPVGRPRPEAPVYDGFVTWLETSLDHAAGKAGVRPGRPAVHRLNRAEYANTIRDLLGFQVDTSTLLPPDDGGFGFDNIADALSVSPALMERYLAVAQRISRLAVGDPSMKPSFDHYKLPYLTLVQDDRAGDDLPHGSRGGMAVRHYFPVDGEYVIKVRVQTSSAQSDVRGLDEPNEVDVRLDGVRVKLFRVETLKNQISNLVADAKQQLDSDWNIHLPVRAGSHVVSVSLDRKTWYMEGVGPSRSPVASFGYTNSFRTGPGIGKVEMGIDEVVIEGPFNGRTPDNSPSRARIFTCYPTTAAQEAPCAKSILSAIARRAYRRPVTPEDVTLFMRFYADGRETGGFDAGIQRALEALLVDPNFLFRVEPATSQSAKTAAYRISDLELASRLSFFLWGSIPDDELLDLAVAGRLKDPAVVERQVRRLLSDSRADAFLNNFFGQWLLVRNVKSAAPDPKAFPYFDDNLRRAFDEETRLFLRAQLREDKSALELLTANYTYVNERLATHYGLSGVYGSHFRRVTMPDDRRAGLLGHGSILMVTSYANRTSVVQRGKWILENLLGTPPPPPPPNVPPLENTKVEGGLRKRMEMHRKNPVCAACHSQLDPLGFALENFNGVGRWRATDEGAAIDASGVMPNGSKFDGPVTFRQALLNHRESLLRTLIEKLLTFAVGRGTEYYDMPAVRKIVAEAAGQEYRWSSLVLGVVRSVPFQMRSPAQ